MLKKYWYIFAGLIAYFIITNKPKIVSKKFKSKVEPITKPEKLD